MEKFPSIVSVKDHLKTCEKAVSHKCLACSKVFTGWIVAQNHVKHWHVGYTVTAFLYSYFEKGCLKNVHATVPKGNMGYDQYTVPDTEAVEPSILLFSFSIGKHTSMGISCHSFKFL